MSQFILRIFVFAAIAIVLEWLSLPPIAGQEIPPANGAAEEPFEEATAPPATTEEVIALIANLDADTFAVREQATQQLIAAGGVAVGPLSESLSQTSLEASNRVLHILRELASGDDAKVADAARDALVQVAALRVSAAARRAASALASVDEIRRQRATQEMEKLGATFENEDTRVGLVPIKNDMRSLTISAGWKGQPDDFSRLPALVDVERLTLEGDRIDDAVLRYVAQMPNLLVITLSRVQVTESGLGELSKLSKLQQLEIKYTPIGDEAIDRLRLLATTPSFRLFGTKITPQGAEKLRQGLPAAAIDYRQGAFLGVGCGPHPVGCEITLVHPGSAAEKGGLLVGDVILRYDGKETPDFDALTKCISQNAAGDTILVQVLRGEERLERKVTLGEWE